jgi:toxin-antitoxin system PIN domain toxin
MFVVDTNVLVYALDEASPEHAKCNRLLEAWRIQPLPWYTTWAILYEFLRVVTHPRALRRPRPMEQAVDMVRSLFACPAFAVLSHTSRHETILAQTVKEIPGLRGSIAHDLATAVLMREHGIVRIVTRDADFHRFPFLEVLDPLDRDWPPGVRERPAARKGRAARIGRRRPR